VILFIFQLFTVHHATTLRFKIEYFHILTALHVSAYMVIITCFVIPQYRCVFRAVAIGASVFQVFLIKINVSPSPVSYVLFLCTHISYRVYCVRVELTNQTKRLCHWSPTSILRTSICACLENCQYKHVTLVRAKIFWRMPSCWMPRRVVPVRTKVSEKRIASIIRVTRICELRPKLAIRSSETSVLTRATRRDIREDGILHSHRREKLKSYIALTSWVL
jgi:hypothetical protein